MIKLLLVDFQSHCICLYTLVVQRVFDSTKLYLDIERKKGGLVGGNNIADYSRG